MPELGAGHDLARARLDGDLVSTAHDTAHGAVPCPRVPRLPAERAGRSFERADQVGGDPASVEVALLRVDALVVQPGGVDASGVEGDVIAQRVILGRRVRVAPANRAHAYVTLAERWNGASWSIQRTPSPGGKNDSGLDSVSCASKTACTAVGGFTNHAGTTMALAERYS